MTKRDDDNPKPKPVKRPAKPKAKWLVPRGIAWQDGKVQVRVEAGATLEAGILPAKLETEYADRGDIVSIDTAEEG